MKYNTDCNHEYVNGIGLKKVYPPNSENWSRTQNCITDKPVLGVVKKCKHCGHTPPPEEGSDDE